MPPTEREKEKPMAGSRLSFGGLIPPIMAVVLFLSSGALTLNVSPSIPLGLYRRAFGAPLTYGAVVRFAGEPYGRSRNFLKYVAALPGDHVTITSDSYIVSGGRIGAVRGDIRPAHLYDGEVSPGYVFVAGMHPYSYDSRYYGPVPVDRLSVYRPLFGARMGCTGGDIDKLCR